MANMAKYSRGACAHLMAHYERRKDEKGQYIKFKNQDIDKSKTKLNYNLAPTRKQGQYKFMQSRCNSVKCLKRADINTMVSWVVTAPKHLEESDYKPFFKHTYDFLENKYGRENVISAYVHMDEKQPHIHFSFVPVVQDAKKGHLKVSAKECVTLNDLKTFHTDLEAYISKEMGKPIHILNEITKEGNKSIEDLKRTSAVQRMKDIETERELARDDVRALKGAIDVENQYNATLLSKGLEKLNLGHFKQAHEEWMKKHPTLSRFMPKGSILVQENDLNQLTELARQSLKTSERDKYLDTLEKVTERSSNKDYEKLRMTAEETVIRSLDLKTDNRKLTREIENLSGEIKNMTEEHQKDLEHSEEEFVGYVDAILNEMPESAEKEFYKAQQRVDERIDREREKAQNMERKRDESMMVMQQEEELEL